MREFTHNIASYMDRAHKGEIFVIMKRNQPVADIVPHNKKRVKPGWSMEMPKLKVKGLNMAEEFVKFRQEERS